MSDRLDKAMERLAAESAAASPPAELEFTLAAEFDRAHRLRRRKRISWMSAGAMAASLVVVAVLELQPPRQPPASPPAPLASVDGFVAIPYTAPLAPYENIRVVRMEVPVAALVAAGLPVQTPDAGALAQADVVVGQDGRARAVRLVSVSSF